LLDQEKFLYGINLSYNCNFRDVYLNCNSFRCIKQTPPLFLIVQHANSIEKRGLLASRHDDTYDVHEHAWSHFLGAIQYYYFMMTQVRAISSYHTLWHR